MWEENLGDFGLEIEPDRTFCFECHAGLSCFGKCCRTEITLTPYDLARLRRHLNTDTDTFLSRFCTTCLDARTGFPFVILKRNEDGACIFSVDGGCQAYESRPGCCRNYPLARVVEGDEKTGERLIRYRLQQAADYCEGLDRGPSWTITGYCQANGAEPYERADDLFLDIPFAFYGLPSSVRTNKDVQQMIREVVFNFDRFFDTYGRFPRRRLPDNDDEMIDLVRTVALGLMERAAATVLNDE